MALPSTVEKVFGYSSIFISIITIISIAFLFVPVYKSKKSHPNSTFLSFHLLINSILFGIFIITNELHNLFHVFECEHINIVRVFSSLPLIAVCLCICFISLLLIFGKTEIIDKRYLLLRIIFLIIIWLSPVVRIVFLAILIASGEFGQSIKEYKCKMKNTYYLAFYFSITGIYYLASVVICCVVIFKLILISSRNLDKSIKSVVKMLISYIITIIIFLIIEIIGEFELTGWQNALIVFLLSLMNPILVFVFTWDKQILQTSKELYCCTTKPDIDSLSHTYFETDGI